MNMTKISRELIDSLRDMGKIRPFTRNDFHGFCGVESPCPMIAEYPDEGILMIIDGDYVELYAETGDGGIEQIDQCDNIRELPYKTEKQIRIESEIAAMEKALAELKKTLKN
jgi:hypothetical protein